MRKLSAESLESVGIGKLYHALSLADYTGDQEALRIVREYIDNLHNFRISGVGLLAFGEPGTGKTFLMVEILKAAMRTAKPNRQYFSVKKTSLGEVVHFFTNSWYNRSSIDLFEKELLTSDFLLIDDVEKLYLSEGNKTLIVSALDKVIRNRVESMKPILITSNEEPTGLVALFGKPIASLLSGHCRIVQVVGKDYRREDAAKDKWNKVLKNSGM